MSQVYYDLLSFSARNVKSLLWLREVIPFGRSVTRWIVLLRKIEMDLMTCNYYGFKQPISSSLNLTGDFQTAERQS